MGIQETQNNKYYAQALHDFLNSINEHFTTKKMTKWIRKRIRYYENLEKNIKE